MAKQIITASTDTASGLGYFLTKLWAKIKATFYTKTETDTKLNSKQATISGGASTITSSNLTASRALISNSSGKVAVSDVTSTELGYLDGVTSNVQTQLNAKAASSDLSKYLPLAGGTVTGNIVKSSPNVQIGKPFVVVDSTPSSSDVYLFFTINLATTAWKQDSGYRITYQCRNAGSKFGFINIETTRASSAASTGMYCGHECLVDNMDAFYYCLENNVVNFYYKQQLPLTIVNVERLSFNELNLAELKSVKLSSLPTNAVLIPKRIAWINSGSSTQPMYLSSGIPTTCSTYAGGTKVTLNGTDKGASTASFYAPTTVGTNYYILTSNGSGAPSWSNIISPDSIELYRGGSTSAGHGGYIDFHYNASTEIFTARIIEYSTDIRVIGKLMIQTGTLYLGANQSYTVTNTDNKYFIRSDAGNTITVPAGSGIPNRNLFILSMVADSTLVYHTYRVNDFAMGDVSLIMRPGKVYHLIAYDENTWYLMNDVDNDHNARGLSVVTSSTLADFYVTNIELASGITLTLPSSQAVQDRELMIYSPNTGASSQIKYQVPAEASTYSTMTLEPFHCIKFIALSGYWYPMVNANI